MIITFARVSAILPFQEALRTSSVATMGVHISLQLRNIFQRANEILFDYSNSGRSGSLHLSAVAATGMSLAAQLTEVFAPFDRLDEPYGYGHDSCCLCDCPMPFDPASPEMSSCPSCGMAVERCCVTLQLALSSSRSGEGEVDTTRFFRCPCCGSTADRAAICRMQQQVRSLQSIAVPSGAWPWSLYTSALCPFCSVLMIRI